MSYDGARKKLDSERYIAWVRELVKSGSPGRIGSSGEPA
jgi:hypothetical protein